MDNESKVKEFCELTGVPKKHAEEILQRYDWNKEEAIEAFFAHEEEDEEQSSAMPAASASSHRASGKNDQASMLDVWNEERKKKTGKDGQYFYVGGEHSGEVVIGPDSQNNSEMVKRLFDAAKEHGAEEVAPEQEQRSQASRIKAFTGSGARLGTAGETSSAAPTSQQPPSSHSPTPKGPRNYRLRMWQNGFSIDDGELRAYTDPESQRFLNAITQGRIPDELLRSAGGSEVHVDLEDHRTEDYTPPAKPKVVAFAGEGQRLGSVVPGVTGTSSTTSTSSQPAAASAKTEEARLEVDESKPITTIQIRLADGSRLVTRANHSHTVSQLRDFIRRARPLTANTPFMLMTMFPNRELTDDSLTVADAGLLNASIVQRASKVA